MTSISDKILINFIGTRILLKTAMISDKLKVKDFKESITHQKSYQKGKITLKYALNHFCQACLFTILIKTPIKPIKDGYIAQSEFEVPTTKESHIDDRQIPIEEWKENIYDSSSEDLESINEEGKNN